MIALFCGTLVLVFIKIKAGPLSFSYMAVTFLDVSVFNYCPVLFFIETPINVVC
jgi:hypothetical protein